MSETKWRPWEARPAPGNVEAAETIYYRDDNPVGGCPVADIYDPAVVPLIAAAPEMADACQRIVDLASGWDADGAIGPREPLSWESVGRAAMDYARYALAKARGEQP